VGAVHALTDTAARAAARLARERVLSGGGGVRSAPRTPAPTRRTSSTVSCGCRSEPATTTRAGRLRIASELLDSLHPAHQAAGRKLYADAKRTERLAERDQRLRAGQHPGNADGRYRAACTYAQRWRLQTPPNAAGTLDGRLAVPGGPHAIRPLQRLLGQLDADLLIIEQLLEPAAQLGSMIQQTRPRI
jgi:hypothetical protein